MLNKYSRLKTIEAEEEHTEDKDEDEHVEEEDNFHEGHNGVF